MAAFLRCRSLCSTVPIPCLEPSFLLVLLSSLILCNMVNELVSAIDILKIPLSILIVFITFSSAIEFRYVRRYVILNPAQIN